MFNIRNLAIVAGVAFVVYVLGSAVVGSIDTVNDMQAATVRVANPH
jgi:hypothetical protein